jgi:hypothetical protein
VDLNPDHHFPIACFALYQIAHHRAWFQCLNPCLGDSP